MIKKFFGLLILSTVFSNAFANSGTFCGRTFKQSQSTELGYVLDLSEQDLPMLTFHVQSVGTYGTYESHKEFILLGEQVQPGLQMVSEAARPDGKLCVHHDSEGFVISITN